jgi:dCTP deaminase
MGVLPDRRLRELGPELMDPYIPEMVQPASIDVRLDDLFFKTWYNFGFNLDPTQSSVPFFSGMIEAPPGGILLDPLNFMLGSTIERVTVPHNLIARFEGKSSLARLGLLTHITAGFIDPGFNGHITVELKNVTPFDILLRPGMPIGQICFEELSEPVERPYGDPSYGSHYQGQRGPTLSRSYLKHVTTESQEN